MGKSSFATGSYKDESISSSKKMFKMIEKLVTSTNSCMKISFMERCEEEKVRL
jgi:hypothetical protein